MTLNGEVVGTIEADDLAKACKVPASNALGTYVIYVCVYARIYIYMYVC